MLEHPHDRIRDPREPVEGHGERDCEPLRLLQRHGLGYELAHDDGEVREDHERDQEGDRGRERGLHEIREERLAEGTDEDREHRDADLDRGDEANRVVHEAECRPGAAAPAPGALDEA